MRRLVVAALAVVALAGCSAHVPANEIMARTSDPVEVQDYVWEAEYDGLADGRVTEQQVGEVLQQARTRWPDRWEFQAMTASHYVRLGDQAQAKSYHEASRALYAKNPAITRGTTAGGTTAGLLGGVVGALVYAAVADDVVVEFPAVPQAETWSPPLGATYAATR